MRILFTGMLSRQCTEAIRGNYDYASIPVGFVWALRHMGHEVTVRKAILGEQKLREQFDLAVVGLNGYHQVSSFKNRFQAIWAISQLPTLLWIQDWQVCYTSTGLKDPESYLWSTVDADYEAEAIKLSEIHRVAAALKRPEHVVLPMSWWGRPEQYVAKHHRWCRNVEGWDPTSTTMHLMPVHDHVEPAERSESWLVTSLSNCSKWIEKVEPRWQVEGYWKLPGQEYVPEQAAIARMSTVGGLLLNSHWHGNKVPGWWRLRYYLAAMKECPIAADPREVGPDLAHHFPPLGVIESMTRGERRELALKQSRAILDGVGPMQRSLDRLDWLLKNRTVTL